MSDADATARLEHQLAVLLRRGSQLASTVIAAGCLLALAGPRVPPLFAGVRIITLGIALFILLPVVRVVVMLAVSWRTRDLRITAVAAAVLAILVLAFALGAVHA